MTPGDRRSGRLPAGDDLMLDECAGTIAVVGAGLGADVCVVEMDAADLGRIREIDRSESVRRKHVYDRGELRPVEINHEIPRWSEEMVAEATEMLAPKLAAGGVLLGAFAGDTLVGVAVLGGDFIGAQSNQLQLVFLYVSNSFRRRGIARQLMDEVCLCARSRGAKQLYISATETESAVGFYFRYGCQLAEAVDPVLYELEPADITSRSISDSHPAPPSRGADTLFVTLKCRAAASITRSCHVRRQRQMQI